MALLTLLQQAVFIATDTDYHKWLAKKATEPFKLMQTVRVNLGGGLGWVVGTIFEIRSRDDEVLVQGPCERRREGTGSQRRRRSATQAINQNAARVGRCIRRGGRLSDSEWRQNVRGEEAVRRGLSRSADPNPFCMTPGLMLAEADAGLPSCTRKGKAGHGNARWAGFFVAYVRVRAPRAQHVARVGIFRVLDRKQRSSVRTNFRIHRLVCAR